MLGLLRCMLRMQRAEQGQFCKAQLQMAVCCLGKCPPLTLQLLFAVSSSRLCCM